MSVETFAFIGLLLYLCTNDSPYVEPYIFCNPDFQHMDLHTLNVDTTHFSNDIAEQQNVKMKTNYNRSSVGYINQSSRYWNKDQFPTLVTMVMPSAKNFSLQGECHWGKMW